MGSVRMNLHEHHLASGASLAPDGIPLRYGNVKAEYHAALNQVVMMDRSHEGRIEGRGRDRYDLIQRISTNDVLLMNPGEGRPTVFTNPNGRILDRIVMYDRGDKTLLMTEPGRGTPVLNYLKRQMFFNDEASFTDLASETHQFVLHGPQADTVIGALVSEAISSELLHSIQATVFDTHVFLARDKPISGSHWRIFVPVEQAEALWIALLEKGATHGLVPAGSLVYNALRIRAGRPAAGRELSPAFIPLEAGLWDEVSFTKGCYTGQEIIARMESRGRLAKTLVKLRLSSWVEAPTDLYLEGKSVGTLTSSVITPDDDILGIGFVKVGSAIPDQELTAGDVGVKVMITELAGAQPPQLAES